MTKGGRPLMEGVIRYANQKINYAATEKLARVATKKLAENDSGDPSPRTKRERDLFNARCFKGGGQAQHAGDAIGQMWLVGLLDTPGMDETRLLDAVRRWWRGREAVLKDVAHKTARYERASRSSGSDTKTSKIERDYYHYRSFLMDASDYEQDCLADLMTPDIDGVPTQWASRVIQTEILKHTILPIALLACDQDYEKWAAAKRAIIAMAGAEAGKRDAA